VLKSTKFQVPDLNVVTQATSSSQVAIPLVAYSATNAKDEDVQISAQPHQVALCAASNGPERLQEQALPMPPRVYPVVAFPQRSLNNGWKLPLEAHEFMGGLDDHPKYVISSRDCASRNLRLSPPEPLPDPAPPENFGNPQQMPVYATHHFKLASSFVYISCDPYHLASTSSALKLPVKIMAHEKIYIQVHHYATDSVSVAKSRSIHFMVATIDEVCAILSQSGFVSLSTSSSVQIECYKYSAISLVIDSCASFLPFLSAFPALSPLLATGLLLHLIPIQVPYFLLLAISLPLALVAKLHLSIILKMVFASYLSLQNLPFKQVHLIPAPWRIILSNQL